MSQKFIPLLFEATITDYPTPYKRHITMHTPLRAVSVALLLIMAALYFYTDKQQSHYQTIAPQQISHMLSEISDWQTDSLSKHLSFEAKQVISTEQLNKVLQQYQPLGRFQKIEALNFSRIASALSLLGKKYIAYNGRVSFAHQQADITITLVEENNRLLISNINLSTPKSAPTL